MSNSMVLGEDDIEDIDNEQIPVKEPTKNARFSAEKFLLTFPKQIAIQKLESTIPDLPEWDKCNHEQQDQWKIGTKNRLVSLTSK